jgi:phosphate transport system protein
MHPSAHISKTFDAELLHIRQRILEMGSIAEYQIRYALESLRTRDAALVEKVVAEEQRVNKMECEIDEQCTQVIAKRAPTAFDLRFLMMSLKIITDLERIGDEAKKITLVSRQLLLSERKSPGYPEIKRMAGEVVEMLRRALDELARFETSDVPDIIRLDREVDSQFKSILTDLLRYMSEDPRTISSSIDKVFVAKALERIGDHAKNISECVVYMTHGRDVRHTSLENIEQISREQAQ